jgi:hypothetical protein
MDDIFSKSDVKFDVDLLRKDLNFVLSKTAWHQKENQISLQYSTADTENLWYSGVGSNWEQKDGKWRITTQDEDVEIINPALKGSYFEHMLLNMPFKPLRTRLMRMESKRCYSVHRDPTARWHIAIHTDNNALFVFTKDQKVLHIPNDGHAYFVDTTREHTAMNGSTNERVHIVMLDPSHALPNDELSQYKW